MATIAEILAARNAGKAPAAAAPLPQAAPRESITQQVESTEAINRIDPPGKSKRGSLILDSKPLPVELPPPAPEDPRMLGARVGEALTVLPDPAPAAMAAWDAVQNSFTTDLVIMSDPNPEAEHAWIALKPATGSALRPILIHKLPFWPHPERTTLPNAPF